MNEAPTDPNQGASRTISFVIVVRNVICEGIGRCGFTYWVKVASSMGMPFGSKITAATSIISWYTGDLPVVSRSKTTYNTLSHLIESDSGTGSTTKGGGGGTLSGGFGSLGGLGGLAICGATAVARGTVGQFRRSWPPCLQMAHLRLFAGGA